MGFRQIRIAHAGHSLRHCPLSVVGSLFYIPRGRCMNVAVAIMVKQPLAGGVKTRLCPPLRPEQAADLYRCFLVDKLAQVRRAAAAAPYLAYTPPEAEGFLRELAGA